jgi:hypothetical protein
MNGNKVATLIAIFAIVLFGGYSASKAQNRTNKKINDWTISSSTFIGLREGGRSFSLDSRGVLNKRSTKDGETSKKVKEDDLREITGLLAALRLPGTKTKIVKGAKVYDYGYWHFGITLDGKYYPMEGFAYNDSRFLVLTKNQKQTFEKLKEKLREIGVGVIR